MEEIKKTGERMVSIWTWVGIVLGVYGLIITAMGVHYGFSPETQTATASYNPSLWWGGVMLVASGLLFVSNLFIAKR
ncbi:MAG: hypothetical protein Kow0090_06500 [Myxococcota bacterium]